MSIGSISTASMAAAAYDVAKPAGEPAHRAAPAAATPAAAAPSVADHVAAADDSEPIRSAVTTQGTMVDVYL